MTIAMGLSGEGAASIRKLATCPSTTDATSASIEITGTTGTAWLAEPTTRMLTESGSEYAPAASVTTKENASSNSGSSCVGATKVGAAVRAPEIATLGPPS